jgi:hypothetical protein
VGIASSISSLSFEADTNAPICAAALEKSGGARRESWLDSDKQLRPVRETRGIALKILAYLSKFQVKTGVRDELAHCFYHAFATLHSDALVINQNLEKRWQMQALACGLRDMVLSAVEPVSFFFNFRWRHAF